MPDNISTDYTLLNQSASIEERQPKGAALPGSLIIRATGAPSEGNTITLTNTVGLAKTYEFDDGGGVSAGNVSVTWINNSDTVYDRLKTAIEGGSGHDGTIACTLNTSPSSYNGVSLAVTLTLTQNVAGIAGNKSVSFTVHNLYNDDPPTTFEGGADAPAPITEGQFLLGTRSTINLRGQTTTSRYRVFLGEEKS